MIDRLFNLGAEQATRCTGKLAYPSMQAALKALKGHRNGRHRDKHLANALDAYRCRFCDGYHIGHRKPSKRPRADE